VRTQIKKPRFLENWIQIKKERGYKGLLQEKGWTILTVFILFYLVRDSMMYILIPYLIVKGVWPGH